MSYIFCKPIENIAGVMRNTAVRQSLSYSLGVGAAKAVSLILVPLFWSISEAAIILICAATLKLLPTTAYSAH